MALIASTNSLVAVSPRSIYVGSPGAVWTIMKFMVITTKINGIASMIRLATSLITELMTTQSKDRYEALGFFIFSALRSENIT